MADTLIENEGLAEFPTWLVERCVELLGAAEVGILLADADGTLRVVASSSERMHVIELFEIQNQQGPCLDCYRTGEPVLNVSLLGTNRWPRFAPMARATGYRMVHALPLRHREQIIGVINIFHDTDRQLSHPEAELTQALADVATISILQNRALRDARDLADQLQHALRSRVALEQAKGVVAERLKVDILHAFTLLRNHARSHNQQLSDIAHRIITGALSPTDLSTHTSQTRSRKRQR